MAKPKILGPGWPASTTTAWPFFGSILRILNMSFIFFEHDISSSRLAKAADAEPAGQMRDERLHAVVARKTSASEKAQNTSRSEHFLKLRCRKSARPCGAKHSSKSKC